MNLLLGFLEVPFNIAPTGITLSNTSLNLTVGSTSIISAEVLPLNAYNKITWQSSNTAIATVTPLSSDTQKAAITAIATGTSVITAATYDGKFTASCTVTVTPQDERYPPIEPISADTLKIILKDVLTSMPQDSQITEAVPFQAAQLPDEVKTNLGCLDEKGYVTKTPDGTFRIPPSAMVQLASTSVPPLAINANELVSMPIFEALISPDMTAIMGFQILGKDFKAPSAGAIILLKAQGDGNVKRYNFTQSASSLTDGHYMLTDASGKIFTASEALISDKQYILVMSIKDNGGYDLDLEKGHILDPASMTSSAHDIQSNQADPGGGMGGCNAQGINILLAGVIAGMVCVRFKRF